MSYNKNIKHIMKKVILSCILSAIVVSCIHNPQGDTQSNNGVAVVNNKLGDFTVKIVDGCEYLEYSYGAGNTAVYSITHKGNCKFCHERQLGMFSDFLKMFGIK